MRGLILLPLLALAACEDTNEDAKSIAYEGRSTLTVPLENKAKAAATAVTVSALDGRYGASAADCDPTNRYMTEYLEIEGPTLSYRGQTQAISVVREGALVLRGGEEIERRGEGLVRWPDQRRKRTVYTRCPD